MRLTRDTSGISRLLLIVLLLVAFVLGVTLSYVWTMSYYAPNEFQLPSKGTVTIESVQFSPQNTSRFNVTILNPSFSPSSVNINKIAVLTADQVLHELSDVSPSLPRNLALGESQTFDFDWDWADFTGQRVTVVAWVDDGSGATFEVEAPFVGLTISELEFNSTISVLRFNATVQNAAASATHVNITQLTINEETVPPQNITIDGAPASFPHSLDPSESAKFTCLFNWTDYQGENVTIAVKTLQGYRAELTQAAPQPVVLTITEAVFNITFTDHFNITIQNAVTSPSDVTVTQVSVTVEDEQPHTIDVTVLPLPQPLPKNSSIQLQCIWDWRAFGDKTVTIMVYTSQGFVVLYSFKLPVVP